MDWQIVVHKNPDIDAICGAWLLRRFGEEKYPGISGAQVMIDNGNVRRGPGLIYVDCGEKDFDHHPLEKHLGECSATLIAKYLEIADDPCLDKILQMVKTSDLTGKDQPFSVAQTIKDLNLFYSDEPQKVFGWAFSALEAKFNAQLDFLMAKFDSKLEKIEVVLPNNLVRQIYVAETSNKQFSKWARHMGATIIVQKQLSSGQVQIFFNQQVQRNSRAMEDLMQMLRVEENRVNKRPMLPVFKDWKFLSAEGKMEEVPEWFYHKGIAAAFNGSLTKDETPRTKIDFQKIKELVQVALNPVFPNPSCQTEQNFCTFDHCRFFYYWLHRCRKLRYQIYHADKTDKVPSNT